jgi:hypothetical protein
VYLDAVDFGRKNVDVMVKEPGERIGPDMALAVLAFGKTLYGNGLTRKEAREFMPVPT